jgi:hypothetical protein
MAVRRRNLRTGLVVLAALLCLSSAPAHLAAPADGLPDRLSNQAFWELSESLSEPPGFFNSDNLISNEDTYQSVIPELRETVQPGGVYVGVGPDQNFTYIAALDPAIAFITDLRRGNLQLHLMYKALFALSSNRVEFLSRLFGRPAPEGLDTDAPAGGILEAFRLVQAEPKSYERTLDEVLRYLEQHRGRPLPEDDRAGIAFVLGHFVANGPDITFVSHGRFRRSRYPSFATLHKATDFDGREWSYLSSEELFARVKSLEERNLLVPVVGNFSGPAALAAIGAWVRRRGGIVTTFYASNVEQYLWQEGTWERFRQNVASLPLDASSTFIRACFNSCSAPGGSRAVSLLDSIPGLLEASARGEIRGYWDVLDHSRYPRASGRGF